MEDMLGDHHFQSLSCDLWNLTLADSGEMMCQMNGTSKGRKTLFWCFDVLTALDFTPRWSHTKSRRFPSEGIVLFATEACFASPQCSAALPRARLRIPRIEAIVGKTGGRGAS